MINIKHKANRKSKKIQIKNMPMFLLIGLIALIIIILLIYFLFLYYSPEMVLRYSGYAIESKTMVENLKNEDIETVQKYINLVDVQEQTIIYKKFNSYYVGDSKEEIDINYPIYLNDGNVLLNLSDITKLITVNYEEVEGYPDFMLTGGIMYNGDDLTRADGNEYLFWKTDDNIYINAVKIQIKTSYNTYEISEYSNINFSEDYIAYYEQEDNYLEYHKIGDIDNKSIISLNNQEITYKDLLERLGIIATEDEKETNENELVEENMVENEVIDHETIVDSNEHSDNLNEEVDGDKNEGESEWQEGEWAKPEVSCTNFETDVYSAKTILSIKDRAEVISRGIVFEFYKNGRLNRRIQITNSGEIEVIGLEPDTDYQVVGIVYYYDENGIDTEEEFYTENIHTLSLDTLGTINFSFENGEIYPNKIEIKNLRILNELSEEVVQGISRIRVQIDGISYNLSNEQVNSIKKGEAIIYQTGETVASNSIINYEIKAYDKYNNELNVENNKGQTRTSKNLPSVNINIVKQDITEVNLNVILKNKDKVEIQNYIYVVINQKNQIVKQGNLDNIVTNKLIFTDLDPSDYFRIEVYADFDLDDGKGWQTNILIGTGTFVTQPISTLGVINVKIETKNITTNSILAGISIDDTKTDIRLITMLHKVTATLTSETGEVHKIELSDSDVNSLKVADTVNLRFEQLTSNTKYIIKIETMVKQGMVEEKVETIQNLQEIFTPKLPAEVQLRNQFIIQDMIDLDYRVEDLDGAVLTNRVRVELRDEEDKLISLEEIDTNQDFIRKKYENLIENTTYKLIFYAPEYNEGQTDSTYKFDYIIKEIELTTEEGISGSIELEKIQRAPIGKNLLDASSKVNWYYNCFNNYNRNYGIEYNEETNIITLGSSDSEYWKSYLYDFSDYIGETVTISFTARTIGTIDEVQLYIDGSNKYLKNFGSLTSDWQEYYYTFEVLDNGFVGFTINGTGKVEITDLQVELGTQRTSYEKYQFKLRANTIINIEDKRDEITTNDYYIRIYKNEELIDERRYEEIGEDNRVDGVRKSYDVDEKSDYKIELLVKIHDRFYTLDYLEFETGDSIEIKGISTIDEYLRIQPNGNYIILNDLDFRVCSNATLLFGGNIAFNGTIDFNGKKIIRDTKNSTISFFAQTGRDAILENIVIDFSMTNEIETSISNSLIVEYNYGTIRNLQFNFVEGNIRQNAYVYLLSRWNYGTIENFVINFQDNIYIYTYFGLVQHNSRNYEKWIFIWKKC